MNKLRWLFALTVFLIIAVSCDKNNGNTETSVRDKFLVDKIYDYDDNLLAEYIYDANNRLIKAIQKTFQDKTDELEFEYENGRVSKIIRYYGHCQGFLFDCNPSEIHFFYNSQGQLIRRKFHTKGFEFWDEENYFYKNGRVASISLEGSLFLVDTLFYDKSNNVTKRIRIFSDLIFEPTEDPVIGEMDDSVVTYYFKYDDRPKPNFGLDYLFAYDLLPVLIGGGSLERALSKNNLTEITVESGRYTEGCTWTYTYNENGLPSTIEIKRKSPYLESEFLRITYKQIE